MRSKLVPILLNSVPGWVRNAYPGVWPSLALAAHYDADQYWIAGIGQVAIDQLQTCTRAATKYVANSAGILVPKAVNINPREDLGLLVEQAATNLCLQSQTFDNASWAKTNASVTADAVVAPDGTTTADKLVESSATGFHQTTQSITVVSATTYTWSEYLKAGERTGYSISLSGATTTGIIVNGLLTGAGTATVAQGSGSPSATITAVANGFYRIAVTFTTNATALTAAIRLATDGAGNVSYTGDGTSGYYVWGAQLEASAFATSYIPTTTVSVARAADSIKANNLSIAAPYSVLLAVGALPSVSADLVNWGSLVNGGGLYGSGGGAGANWVREASVTTSNVASSGTFSVNTAFKLAARFTTNDTNTSLNGAIGTHDTSSIPPTIATLGFGTSQVSFGGSMPNGPIKRLTIFSSGLSDAQLQALTT